MIIRTIDELQILLHKNPFLKEKNIDKDRLHVTFLAEDPAQTNVNSIKDLDYKPDRFIISVKEVYLYCPNGYGRTTLNNNYFENKLKVTATTRNWRTVNELFRIMSTL